MEEIEDELNLKRQKVLRKLSEDKKNELFEAIRDGKIERAKEIIDIMEDVDEEIKDDSFGSALHFSCHNGRIELVKYLIELGADVDKTDAYKRSPLFKALLYGSIEIVQLLLNAGADINYIDENGNSALSAAVDYNHLKIFELLIFSGVDIEKCEGEALLCASHANVEVVKRLIELGVDVNFVDESDGWTALHCACLRNNFKMVELLMEQGADENIKNNDGKTPIELTKNEEIKEFIKNFNLTKYVLK